MKSPALHMVAGRHVCVGDQHGVPTRDTPTRTGNRSTGKIVIGSRKRSVESRPLPASRAQASEAELVRRARDGEVGAYEELVRIAAASQGVHIGGVAARPRPGGKRAKALGYGTQALAKNNIRAPGGVNAYATFRWCPRGGGCPQGQILPEAHLRILPKGPLRPLCRP